MPRSAFKTALVLSGGSARGLTHIGVLEEIQRHDIQIDLIVGTSMGAVVGALYASYGTIAKTLEKMRELVESDLFVRTLSLAMEDVPAVGPDGFFNRFMWLFRRGVYYTHSMIRPTLVPEETYTEVISQLIPDGNIEDLAIPFAAVSMDLFNGEEVVLSKGSLRKAVSASAAIPGILPPVEIHGRALVDGGWIDNVPVAPAIALGAHFVIAVDASLDTVGLGPVPSSAIESLFRCNEISRITLTHQRRSHADVILVPDIGHLYWANFGAMDRCISAGRDIVNENLLLIRQKMENRRLKSLRGRLHPARQRNWRHPFIVY